MKKVLITTLLLLSITSSISAKKLSRNIEINQSTKFVLVEKHTLFKKRYEVISRPALLPRKCRYNKSINTVFIYSK